MSPDLRRVLRRVKPEKHRTKLAPRPLEGLVSAASLGTGRMSVVPDTNVYIHAAAGSLPEPVADLLDRSLQLH